MTARKREHDGASRRGRGPGRPFTPETGRRAALRRHAPGHAPALPENMAQMSLQSMVAMMAPESREGGGRSPAVLLRLLRDDVLDQMVLLATKTRLALASLNPARAGDHRALASTLVVLSERIDQSLLAAEGGGQGDGESYEHRLARAYTSRGLAVPGRLAMTLRGQGFGLRSAHESSQGVEDHEHHDR